MVLPKLDFKSLLHAFLDHVQSKYIVSIPIFNFSNHPNELHEPIPKVKSQMHSQLITKFRKIYSNYLAYASPILHPLSTCMDRQSNFYLWWWDLTIPSPCFSSCAVFPSSIQSKCMYHTDCAATFQSIKYKVLTKFSVTMPLYTSTPTHPYWHFQTNQQDRTHHNTVIDITESLLNKQHHVSLPTPMLTKRTLNVRCKDTSTYNPWLIV